LISDITNIVVITERERKKEKSDEKWNGET